MKKYFIFILLLNIFIPTKSIIISMDVWMKIIDGQKHYIYGLGDLHADMITNQITDLLEISKKLNKENILFLTEIDEKQPKVLKYFKDVDFEIMVLHESLKENNIPVIGVDNRRSKITDFGSKNSENFNKNDLLYFLQKLKEQYLNYCKQIESYKDNKYLTKLYNLFAKALKTKLQIITDNINNYSFEDLNIYVENIKLHTLFNEIETLHQIYNHQTKNHIFLYFGQDHIKNLDDHLINLGYKKIFTYGYTNLKIPTGLVLKHKEDVLSNKDIKIETVEDLHKIKEIKSLNIKYVFDDLNNRFNIFNSSNQIMSKL